MASPYAVKIAQEVHAKPNRKEEIRGILYGKQEITLPLSSDFMISHLENLKEKLKYPRAKQCL